MDWHPVERRALTRALSEAGPGAPTLCEGWRTEHLAAHVALRESSPSVAAGIVVPALQDRTERIILELGDRSSDPAGWSELLDRVRRAPSWWNPLQWAGDAAQLLELHVHVEDVRRGVEGAATPARRLARGHEEAVWRRLVQMSRVAYARAGVPVTLVADGRGRRHVVGGRGAGGRGGTLPDDGVTLRGGVTELVLHAFGRRGAAGVTVEGSPDAVAALGGSTVP